MPNPQFPSRAPLGFLCGAMLSILIGFGIFALWLKLLDPLPKFYLKPYVTTAFWQFVPSWGKTPRTKQYVIVMAGAYPALPYGSLPGKIELQLRSLSPKTFHSWLRTNIFGKGFVDLLRTPLIAWGCCAFVFMIAGGVWDQQRRRKAREGIRLRGPRLKTVAEFNKAQKGKCLVLDVEDVRL